MSIYGTMGASWRIDGHDVLFQEVNGDITDDGARWAFLSPATRGGYDDFRDVFVVCCCTEKATPRNGQEYIDPLMHMSYRDFRWYMDDPKNRRALRSRLRTRLVARGREAFG